MNDLFAPPGNTWQPVSPQLRRLRRAVLSGLTGTGLLAVVGYAVATRWTWWLLLAGLALVLVFTAGWALVGRNVRNWGYAERDEDLYVKHGALFKALVAVPYGRMQYVDVTSGPLEQLYGIASVHLHTASPKTSASIPGLPRDEAARLRDRLTSLGQAQAAGL